MKNRHWLHRFGAGLLGTALAAGALPVQTLAPILAEESQPVQNNQMISAPETVYLDEYDASQRSVSFNEHWKFSLSDPTGASEGSFDDSRWDDINLPHDYSIDQEYTGSGEAESGYKLGGTAWYRKTFTLGENVQGKRVIVEFGGVYMDASIYLNGRKLGEHPYGYTGFAFDLTDDLNYEGENVLSVRVNHQTPSSRWYSGSGIYRDVNLTITDHVHAACNGISVTTPNLEKESASVTTATGVTVENTSDASADVTVVQTVLDENGASIGTASTDKTIAGGSSETVSINVMAANPKLWSVDSPNLYTLKTEIKQGDTVVDTVETPFGYRWYSFDRDTGFSLNGQKMKLKGVCMHHDQGALGAEANDRAIERQVEILKKMGCNAIRVTHNPADKALLDAASRQGILIIDEMFDGWIKAKNGNSKDYARFFQVSVGSDNEILNTEAGDTWAEFDVRSAVQSSRTQPSVIMYSLVNEVYEGTDKAYPDQAAIIAADLIAWIRESDPERFVTFGGNKLKGGNSEDPIAEAVNAAGGIVGYNYASGSEYDSARNSHSAWTIYGSETASHTNSRGVYDRTGNNVKSPDKLLTSYDYSSVSWGSVASDAWYQVITRDFVAGEFVWTGFDYLGEPTPWNETRPGFLDGTSSPKSSYFGIVDTAGLPKDNYYLYQSQWNDSIHTLHVLPAWNKDVVVNGGNGNVPVVVYSDAASVELFFTPAGSSEKQSLGKKTFTRKTTEAGYTYQIYEGSDQDVTTHRNLYLTWNVPYADGTIEAVAYDESNQVIQNTDGRKSVTTTGAASKLSASADHETIKADGADLSYITINVEDAAGNIVPSAKNVVSVSVSGSAELAGMDNGVQADQQSYRDGNRKAQAGQLVAIIRSKPDVSGPATVTITSPGLESTTVTLNAAPVEGSTTEEAWTEFEYSRNYFVKAGTMPSLAETVKATNASGKTDTLPVVWDTIPADKIAQSGSFTVRGIAGGRTISANVTVIDNVSTLLNVSVASKKGMIPTLPSSRPAVLNDGTVLATNFDITWNMPDTSAFNAEGVVTVNGTANVLGDTVPVTATVRVADVQPVIGDSVSSAAYVSQDIAADKVSDRLESVNDGSTIYNPENKIENDNQTIWSNYNNCWTTPENKTAALTFRYDTQQRFGQFVVHFVSDTWSASYPDAETTYFEISEDGTNWTRVEARETIGTESGRVKPYTYDFEPLSATYVRLNVVNTDTKKSTGSGDHNPSTGISEVELKSVDLGDLTSGTSAALSSLSLDGSDVSATELSSRSISTPARAPKIEAAAQNNGAITILPAEDGKQVILVQSEDGMSLTKYTISLGVVSPDDDSRDIPYNQTTATAGSEETGQSALSKSQGPASYAVDNSASSMWHTKWAGDQYENLWLQISTDKVYMVDGLRYLPRQSDINGKITAYRIEAENENGKWVTVATGEWPADTSWHLVSFDPIRTDKVRLYATEIVSEQVGKKFASAAEVRLTGTEAAEIPADLDYSLLKTAISKAKSLSLADCPDGDAKTALTTELALAKALDDAADSQEAIDAQTTALHNALLALRLTVSQKKLDSLK